MRSPKQAADLLILKGGGDEAVRYGVLDLGLRFGG